MKFQDQKSYIEQAKNDFNELFKIEADDNLELFMKYMTDITNRDLILEFQLFHKFKESNQ